jgi:hypothetical protein
MKGHLYKKEMPSGWYVAYTTDDFGFHKTELPLHPEDAKSLIDTYEINPMEGKEVEFDWCVIVNPDGKGKEYARLTKPKSRIDLQNLETKLNQSLSEETDWTLSKWLKSKREQKKLIIDIMNKDAKDGLYENDVDKLGYEDVRKLGYDEDKLPTTTSDLIDSAIWSLPFDERMKCWELIEKLIDEEKETLYTEEQMKLAFEYGKTLEPFDCFEDFLQSLKQPKQ